jgi:hypothetical protein
MRAYSDSSFILRLVLKEPDSEKTIARYILHIASALTLESELFLTTDEHQALLAKAEGLKVAPVR